jgi:hypothetical protein
MPPLRALSRPCRIRGEFHPGPVDLARVNMLAFVDFVRRLSADLVWRFLSQVHRHARAADRRHLLRRSGDILRGTNSMRAAGCIPRRDQPGRSH